MTEVGDSLAKIKEIAGCNTYAKVAVVYDWESRWAMENAQGPRNQGLYYKETVEKSYSAFRKLGLDICSAQDLRRKSAGLQKMEAGLL